MNKKLLAVAVSAALAPAFAQAQSSSVVLSGAWNFWYENVSASGSSGASGAFGGGAGIAAQTNMVSRGRISDGAGSNVRFAVEEDLGNGLKAWGQLETAVFNNADTRNNAIGASPTAAPTGIQSAGGWGTRNTGVGLKSAAWGSVLIGIWDIHYNTQYAVDPSLIKGASHQSVLGLFNNMGTGTYGIGARYSNVIRYDSPNWNGFNLILAYSRPTDGVVATAGALIGGAASQLDGKKNQVWSFSPSYNNGPFTAFYSYLQDKDISSAAAGAGAGNPQTKILNSLGNPAAAAFNTVGEVRSDRAGIAWAFPFGLRVGLAYDSTKYKTNNQITAGAFGGVAVGQAFNADYKRTAWAIPVTFDTGRHSMNFTYAKANDISCSTGVTTGCNTSGTKANMWQLGYQYAFSKRTNLHASYTRINNDSNANYDGFANGVGLGATGNNGADPTYVVLGLRHAF